MKIFGFEFNKKNETPLVTFDYPDDPSSEMVQTDGYGANVAYFQTNENTTEEKLIETYRDMANSSEFGPVLTELKNEVLIFENTDKKAVSIDFYSTSQLPDSVKEAISQEFDHVVYDVLDLRRTGTVLLESWFVDSRLYLHKIVDINNKTNGIQKIIPIDPLKMRKIVDYPKPSTDGLIDLSKSREYYIFSNRLVSTKKNKTSNQWNMDNALIEGAVIGKEYITYIDSGLYDRNAGMVISHLFKSIKPFNDLRLMEEALLIYRIARSPERRVFYIDVTGMPKPKAEQHMKNMMNKFRNKINYDAKTGTLLDKTNTLSVVEDYWLPRRAGGAAGTEITTLQGGDKTGVIDDVDYFRKKFYKSLNVPPSRFGEEVQTINYGSSNSEITRDELRFKKFVDSLRNQFSLMFEDLLKTQLILKEVITDDEWPEVRSSIFFRYQEDNNFVESKNLETLNKRLTSLDSVKDYVGYGEGKFFSKKWVCKNVLSMTDEEIETMENEQEEEKLNKPVEDPNPSDSIDPMGSSEMGTDVGGAPDSYSDGSMPDESLPGEQEPTEDVPDETSTDNQEQDTETPDEGDIDSDVPDEGGEDESETNAETKSSKQVELK